MAGAGGNHYCLSWMAGLVLDVSEEEHHWVPGEARNRGHGYFQPSWAAGELVVGVDGDQYCCHLSWVAGSPILVLDVSEKRRWVLGEAQDKDHDSCQLSWAVGGLVTGVDGVHYCCHLSWAVDGLVVDIWQEEHDRDHG